MAITVKNDTSGQAIGAVGLSAGIDKNRAYRLSLDQLEIQRQQLAAQQKASEQRFQEYKDRLIREDKMNEREAEIKARTLEAAARESEANLAMQKERLDLERANSEAAAGRADANIDIQRQQLAQNSNANQMALHQQKLSYTQEAENAKIDEALRRIQSDVASGRLSPAAAKEMTRQLNDKRYGTNTPQEEPTLAEQYAMETLTTADGNVVAKNNRDEWYILGEAEKNKRLELEQKKTQAEQDYQLKKQDAWFKAYDSKSKQLSERMNDDNFTPLYTPEEIDARATAFADRVVGAISGMDGTQVGGASDPQAAKVLSVAGILNEGKIQTGNPEAKNIKQVFDAVVPPLYALDSSGNQKPVSPEAKDANYRQYLLMASKAGIALEDAKVYYDQNVDKAKPVQKQTEITSFKDIDMANPEDAKRAEYGYATYVKEQERAGTDPKLILPYEDWLLEMDKNPELFDKHYNKKIDYSSKERQAKQTAAGNSALPLGFLLTN